VGTLAISKMVCRGWNALLSSSIGKQLFDAHRKVYVVTCFAYSRWNGWDEEVWLHLSLVETMVVYQ
jgi:hypothetical protein